MAKTFRSRRERLAGIREATRAAYEAFREPFKGGWTFDRAVDVLTLHPQSRFYLRGFKLHFKEWKASQRVALRECERISKMKTKEFRESISYVARTKETDCSIFERIAKEALESLVH